MGVKCYKIGILHLPNMQIKHIYSGLSISEIAKILKNKFTSAQMKPFLSLKTQQLKGSIKKLNSAQFFEFSDMKQEVIC